ncbi:hypothetical protein [Maribacter sp. 2210JD10-5]|uniref:hypothetical protein n=1 Tax=Maribacter sp. 2210JD10-5 TaxID=3386272 RepID=UPI0039BC3DDE
MLPKNKALLFNFISFVSIFLVIRFSLSYLFDLKRIVLVLIAAVSATTLSPKFAAVKTKEGEKLFVKWIFRKGVKEI